MALIEDNAKPPRVLIEIERAVASRTGLFRRRSFWDALASAAAAPGRSPTTVIPIRAAPISTGWNSAMNSARRCVAAAARAPRNLRRELAVLERASRIVFVCPRARRLTFDPQKTVRENS